jgi:hypothetical protein
MRPRGSASPGDWSRPPTAYSASRPPRAGLPMSCARVSRPLLIPGLSPSSAVREFMFRTVSQITLNYRHGPLSRGVAGHVHGGDRLPWAPVDGADNFATLATMDWQVHVYGAATCRARRVVREPKLPLHSFTWRPEYEEAGLPAMRFICSGLTPTWRLPTVLARPSVERYFRDHGIKLRAAKRGVIVRSCFNHPAQSHWSGLACPLSAGQTGCRSVRRQCARYGPARRGTG